MCLTGLSSFNDTGICGPSVDPQLIRFAADLEWLQDCGVSVARFNLAQQPKAFAESAAAKQALESMGEAALSLILVDGVVKSSLQGRTACNRRLRQCHFRYGANGAHPALLLDATEAYHREVLSRASGSPEAVQKLLPRLRDPAFTHVILVTLPEATSILEAMQLERDLARAEIKPTAWVVNQCLTSSTVTDPVLRSRQANEASYMLELSRHTSRLVLEVWHEDAENTARPSMAHAS